MSTVTITETSPAAVYTCQKCTPASIAAHLAEVAALFDNGGETQNAEDSRAHIPYAAFEIYAGLIFNREYAAHYVKAANAPAEAFDSEYKTLEHLGLITAEKDETGRVEGYALNWFESEAQSLATVAITEHPANVAAHLARVSEHLLGTAESVEVAAEMFQQYLEVFTARECQGDFTSLESLSYPGSYGELEKTGLVQTLVDDKGKPGAYLLTMFAEDSD